MKRPRAVQCMANLGPDVGGQGSLAVLQVGKNGRMTHHGDQRGSEPMSGCSMEETGGRYDNVSHAGCVGGGQPAPRSN